MKIDYKVGKFPFAANGKCLSMGENSGFAKILIDKGTGRILGAHMIGIDVPELLPELTLAENNGLDIHSVIDNIHVHPTLSEVILEAAEDTAGISIHI
ncbi:MAG: hypothetical protein AB9907_01130 [Flexilinea sp.]